MVSNNLLVNGSFETGPNPGVFTFFPLFPGSKDIFGWDIIRGGIDYVRDLQTPADGNSYLDLNGTPGVGGVAQSFDTKVGQQYLVTFDLAAHPSGLLQTMRVSAAGQSADFYFQSKSDPSNLGWQALTWEFTAISRQTTLELYSLQTGYQFGGPALDGVVVTAINQINDTKGKNKLVGTAGTDELNGLNGKDTLIGMAGNDILNGGNGADILIGVDSNAIVTEERTYTQSLQPGQYSDYSITGPWTGLLREDGTTIGQWDDPSVFQLSQHVEANQLWFASGFMTWDFPINISKSAKIQSISYTAEISSEIGGTNSNWPSNLTISLNDTDIDIWTIPGDPDYGWLTTWTVDTTGTYFDSKFRTGDLPREKVSEIKIQDLAVVPEEDLHLKLSVPYSSNGMGLTIYGKGILGFAGDYYYSPGNTPTIRIHYEDKYFAPGLGEVDTLTGGKAPDTFVLGDVKNVYYDDHNPSTQGLNDYALITDFSNEDIIQLNGKANKYLLDETYSLGGSAGTAIFYKDTINELIGFVEGVTGLNLKSNDFSFTGCL